MTHSLRGFVLPMRVGGAKAGCRGFDIPSGDTWRVDDCARLHCFTFCALMYYCNDPHPILVVCTTGSGFVELALRSAVCRRPGA